MPTAALTSASASFPIVALAPSPPPCFPPIIGTYADRDTQAVFDAWDAGCRYVAMILTESTLETEALVEKIQALSCKK